MGKGTIISGGNSGLYQVQINFNRSLSDAQIIHLDDALTRVETQISDKIIEIGEQTTPKDVLKKQRELAILRVQRLSLEKRKEFLEVAIPEDQTIAMWCADLTEQLSGEVGVVELPGEAIEFNIQPGYENNAIYNLSRDGQVTPTFSMTPEQVYYNLAMLPGWQKWKPTFRYATIDSLNGDVADITLDTALSTQQSLVINQSGAITDVAIEYMECDGQAFSVGDTVLVKFENQDFSSPKIIGFKDNPKPCGGYFITITRFRTGAWTFTPLYCSVFNLEANALATTVTNNAGDIVSFPCLYSDISTWLGNFTTVQIPAVSTTYGFGSIMEPMDYLVYDHDITEVLTTFPCEGSPSQTCSRTDYSGTTTLDDQPPGLRDIVTDMEGYEEEWYDGSPTLVEKQWDSNIDWYAVYQSNIVSQTNAGGTRYREGSQSGLRDLYVDYTYGNGGQQLLEEKNQTDHYRDPFFSDDDMTFSYSSLDTELTIGLDPTPECITWTKAAEPINPNFNASGAVGNVQIPYLFVFAFVEIGKLYSSSNSYSNFVCDPPLLTVTTTDTFFKSYQSKAFLQKVTNEGDNPMDLNPFDISENTGLNTIIDDLATYVRTTHSVDETNAKANHTFAFLV